MEDSDEDGDQVADEKSGLLNKGGDEMEFDLGSDGQETGGRQGIESFNTPFK